MPWALRGGHKRRPVLDSAGMCEVWKWIAIGSSIPVFVTLAVDLTKWRGLAAWFAWWRPYLRLWWLNALVFTVSLLIYGHCAA
jgi:hypothetical protein